MKNKFIKLESGKQFEEEKKENSKLEKSIRYQWWGQCRRKQNLVYQSPIIWKFK